MRIGLGGHKGAEGRGQGTDGGQKVPLTCSVPDHGAPLPWACPARGRWLGQALQQRGLCACVNACRAHTMCILLTRVSSLLTCLDLVPFQRGLDQSTLRYWE